MDVMLKSAGSAAAFLAMTGLDNAVVLQCVPGAVASPVVDLLSCNDEQEDAPLGIFEDMDEAVDA